MRVSKVGKVGSGVVECSELDVFQGGALWRKFPSAEISEVSAVVKGYVSQKVM